MNFSVYLEVCQNPVPVKFEGILPEPDAGTGFGKKTGTGFWPEPDLSKNAGFYRNRNSGRSIATACTVRIVQQRCLQVHVSLL